MIEKEELIANFIKDELTDVPNILNKELSNNNMKFNSREELDEIKGYLDTFLKEDTSNKIIVLPGLRGVGKTTLILQAYEYLLKEKNIPPNNVLYISFDDLNDLVECNIRQMVEVYLKNIFHANLRNLDEKVFIFVDESQIDKKWASSGKVIYDKSYNIFMIFTGSSALHLERSDDLARRMRKKSITPLNYTQHLKLKYGDIEDEEYSIGLCFDNWDALGVKGAVIRIYGKIEAFTIGDKMNDQVAHIHFEKANPEIRGLYQAINRDFILHEFADTEFVNREEDLGVPGLRQAKMEYNPDHFAEKYNVVLAGSLGK